MKLRLPIFAGKLLGALLGYVFAGWLGFILGSLLGHSFDHHRSSVFHWSGQQLKRRFVRRDRIYREALFTCLGHLAKQDGQVSSDEIALTEQLFRQMKLSAHARDEAIHYFNLGKLPDVQLGSVLQPMQRRYARQPKKRLSWISQLLPMVYLGGTAHPQQLKSLNEMARLLDISAAELHQLKQPYVTRHQSDETQQRQQRRQTAAITPLAQAYRQLNLPADANLTQVKQAYRRLMSQHHPDKLVAQQLTPAELELAKQRTQEIQQAYMLLKKALG